MGNISTSEKNLGDRLAAILDAAGFVCHQAKDFVASTAIVENLFLEKILPLKSPKLAEHLKGKETEQKKFFIYLSGEILKKGIAEFLRRGTSYNGAKITPYFTTPDPTLPVTKEEYNHNIFGYAREVYYQQNGQNRIDFVIFLNGFPLVTIELKNNLTGTSAEKEGVEQYCKNRDPKEPLLNFKRCLAHFAADENHIKFCTELAGEETNFMPFDHCYSALAALPESILPSEDIWQKIFTKKSISALIEKYSQITIKNGEERLIFPRFHQFECVELLAQDANQNAPGIRRLIEHSAGSGKSNTIAWLSYTLITLRDSHGNQKFDSVFVITDRRNLDKQITNTVKQFSREDSMVGHANKSSDLLKLIQNSKRIIITTIQKFQYILECAGDMSDKRFAVIIDEAHSSQSGTMADSIKQILGDGVYNPDDTPEEKARKIQQSRRFPNNVNYYAFTATPKEKTLEYFAQRYEDENGEPYFAAFHTYTMRQAIDEGFILNVLNYYMPISTYFKAVKKSYDDPKYKHRQALGAIYDYIQHYDETIENRAKIIEEHFYLQVFLANKIGGRAKAMVVTQDIESAIKYYIAIERLLRRRGKNYKAILAFSGEVDYDGQKVTEAWFNGFPSSKIENYFDTDEYRILVVADKFQTGFDQPLLYVMYVDKTLAGVQAVQTLSRLNRTCKGKHDTMVLDFRAGKEKNETQIANAFATYFNEVELHGETDPNQLNDLHSHLENSGLYNVSDVDRYWEYYTENGTPHRAEMNAIHRKSQSFYNSLDEDGQVDVKSTVKKFIRAYSYLAPILPVYADYPEWEKLYHFLYDLYLPSPKDEDNLNGLFEKIGLNNRKPIKRDILDLTPDSDETAILAPKQWRAGGKKGEDEKMPLSELVDEFNKLYGDKFANPQLAISLITNDLYETVVNDEGLKSVIKFNTDDVVYKATGDKIESVMLQELNKYADIYKLWATNIKFKSFVTEMIFKKMLGVLA